jgi:hypothetical protein
VFNLVLMIGNKFSLRIAYKYPCYDTLELCEYCFALRLGEFQIYKKKMTRLE